MFGMAPKTLIVVFKDEMVLNQFKKMTESRTGGEDDLSADFPAVNVVAWDEKVWLSNKKSGTIKDKVLFLGDVKGTDQLIPVIDVQFNEFGVKYGWAGNQAVVFCDLNALNDKITYEDFIEKLAELPVPEIIRKSLYDKSGADEQENTKEKIEEPQISDADSIENIVKKKAGFLFKKAKRAIEDGVNAVNKAGGANVAEKAGIFVAAANPVGIAAAKSVEWFKDRNTLKRQMMFYGAVNFYQNDLKVFMNL